MTEQTNEDWMKHMSPEICNGSHMDNDRRNPRREYHFDSDNDPYEDGTNGGGWIDTWGRGKGACDESNAEREPDYRVDSLICDENGSKTNIHIYISLYIQQTQA